MKVSLPHGSELDTETNEIKINLGSVILNFSLEEWEEFITIIGDVDTVLQANLKVESFICPSCGSANNSFEYNEPTEEEYN